MAKQEKKGFYYDNTVEITFKGKKVRVGKQVAEILTGNKPAPKK